MNKRRSLPGINIQFPISGLILAGSKTIETRTYPIPETYVGKDLALIETPGPTGSFKARVVGTIRFGESFEYPDEKTFYNDFNRHRVSPDSPWKWTKKCSKWGWPILMVTRFKTPLEAPKKKGIVFTKTVAI